MDGTRPPDIDPKGTREEPFDFVRRVIRTHGYSTTRYFDLHVWGRRGLRLVDEIEATMEALWFARQREAVFGRPAPINPRGRYEYVVSIDAHATMTRVLLEDGGLSVHNIHQYAEGLRP